MKTQQFVLGKFIEKRRKERFLSRKDLAQLCGYINLSKGIRRLKVIEEGSMTKHIITKVIEALDISEEEIEKCEKAEELYIKDCISKLPPFKPFLVHRVMPAIYRKISLPEGYSERELLDLSIEMAKKFHGGICLEYDYNKRYSISSDGKIFVYHDMNGGPRSKPDIGSLL